MTIKFHNSQPGLGTEMSDSASCYTLLRGTRFLCPLNENELVKMKKNCPFSIRNGCITLFHVQYVNVH
jgi:hypothetical protein